MGLASTFSRFCGLGELVMVKLLVVVVKLEFIRQLVRVVVMLMAVLMVVLMVVLMAVGFMVLVA